MSVFRFNPDTFTFEQKAGDLQAISVGLADNGEEMVWGINFDGDVFRFNSLTQLFENIPGIKLASISNPGSQGDIWGLDSDSNIFAFSVTSQRFVQIPGKLAMIVNGGLIDPALLLLCYKVGAFPVR